MIFPRKNEAGKLWHWLSVPLYIAFVTLAVIGFAETVLLCIIRMWINGLQNQ